MTEQTYREGGEYLKFRVPITEAEVNVPNNYPHSNITKLKVIGFIASTLGSFAGVWIVPSHPIVGIAVSSFGLYGSFKTVE